MGLPFRDPDPEERLRQNLELAHETLHDGLRALDTVRETLAARHEALLAHEDYEPIEGEEDLRALRTEIDEHFDNRVYALLARGSLADALKDLDRKHRAELGHGPDFDTRCRYDDEGELVYYAYDDLSHRVDGLEPVLDEHGEVRTVARFDEGGILPRGNQLLLRYSRAQIAEELKDLQAIDLLLSGESGLGHLRGMIGTTERLHGRASDALDTVERMHAMLDGEREVEDRYDRLDDIGERMQRFGASLA